MIRSAIIHTKFIYRRLAPRRLIPCLFIIIMFFLSLFLQTHTQAKVTGRCDNCHTMHYSQNGTIPPDKNDEGIPPDIGQEGPYEYLLTDTCVGCHSNTGSETIVEFAGSRIPIVYNTTPLDKPLAGGNFYWVSQSDNENENFFVRKIG